MNPQPCLSAEFLFVFSFDGEQLTSSWSYTIDFIYLKTHFKNVPNMEEGRGLRAFYYTSPQSFIIRFPHFLPYQLWGLSLKVFNH